MTKIANLSLNDGQRIPPIGFGTNVLRGRKGIDSILTALDAGYRLIDTAQSYDNEEIVGAAVAESSVPRQELVLTTKITDAHQGYQQTLDSFEVSLAKLKTDWVDILLVHWPNVQDFERSLETWRALIDLQQAGKVTTIGVSNCTPDLLQRTIDASGMVPALNQVEFHPFLVQKDLLAYCQQKEIRIEAYCPIARAERAGHPVLQQLAAKYQKSPVQIMLRWHVELGIIPIPRSENPDHIRANFQIFDFSLEEDEVREISGLNENYRIIKPDKSPPGW